MDKLKKYISNPMLLIGVLIIIAPIIIPVLDPSHELLVTTKYVVLGGVGIFTVALSRIGVSIPYRKQKPDELDTIYEFLKKVDITTLKMFDIIGTIIVLITSVLIIKEVLLNSINNF
jgi:hypothetical protein